MDVNKQQSTNNTQHKKMTNHRCNFINDIWIMSIWEANQPHNMSSQIMNSLRLPDCGYF